jgi:transcriptional regulator with XRE-family HTH domain
MKLAVTLKRLREERKMSMIECAKYIKVSPSTYRDWEYGRSISGEPYQKIAKLFNVSISELFGNETCQVTTELNNIELRLEEALTHLKDIKASL